MLSQSAKLCFMVLLLLLAVTACSRDSVPVDPGLTDTIRDASVSQSMCWGTWDVTIDANSGEIELVPERSGDFTANVTRFLQPPISPIELVGMSINMAESDILTGLITMDVTLRHPFPGKTLFRGFDVRGIIHADGGAIGKYDPSAVINPPDGIHMTNPDGFTRWFNQVEFTNYGLLFGYTEGHYAVPNYTSTQTICPYKIHTPSLDPRQPYYQMDYEQRCTFPAIDGFSKRMYRIKFDDTQSPMYRFKYSISANWSRPDPDFAPEYPIEAFDSMANMQEPYMVKIEEYEDIPYYVDEYVAGGNLQFLLTIGDWQAVGGNVLDEISHVWIESPTLFEFPVDVRDTMEFVSSGHDTQATYRIFIEDMFPTALDGQQMLITVESTDPDSFEPQIEGDTSMWVYPDAPLAAYCIGDVPVTNLTPTGEYAYCYFVPDWCATMRYQCASDSQNQLLISNIISQNVEGYYNDFTHIQSWEGKTTSYVWGQNSDALADTCASLGYSFERTHNDYFDPGGSRVVLAVIWSNVNTPLDPPFTQEEAHDMQEFIENGGILIFMCEKSSNMHVPSLDNIFDWLGMLMEYGGGATPESADGWTSNITWHWLTDGVEVYHYFTCGQWLTEDPHVLTLVATEYDEKAVLMYPLPLE